MKEYQGVKTPSGVVWSLIVLFMGLIASNSLFAGSCKSILERLENSRLKAIVQFSANSRPAELKGFPLHFTSNPTIQFIWLTRPDSGSEYFVIEKGNTGFGFSAPPTFRFRLIDDDAINLRSLDFSGDGEHLLATLVAADAEGGNTSVLMKAATISDTSTGELQLMGVPGLEISNIANNGNGLVVTAQTNTNEFWMTDSGSKVRIIATEESGRPVLKSEFDLADQNVESVSKVQFFQNGQSGYMRVKMNDGTLSLVPFSLISVEGQTEAQLDLAWKQAYPIKEGYVRTSVHPSESIIIVSYKDHIEAVGFNVESRTFTKVLDQKIDFLKEGQEILGVEYYWNGEIRQVKTENGPEPSFFGNVEAALLVGQNNRQSTLLYWLNVSGN